MLGPKPEATGMRYDVRVSDGTHFEHEQDEPLAVGDWIRPLTMSYEVTAITPLGPEESDDFDAIAEVVWRMGPAQASYH